MSDNIKKTIIYMPVYNRRTIALESISNMRMVKREAHLSILDDASTEFSGEEIIKLGDSGRVNQANRGIEITRVFQLVDFLNSQFEYCYFTDSDTIHDPDFLDRLFYMHSVTNCICSLYNTTGRMHKSGFNIYLGDDIIIRNSIPGVSMFLNREQAERIYNYYNDGQRFFNQIVLYHGWDWLFCQASPVCALSKTSYLEHLYVGGIHGVAPDHGLNLTPWLQQERVQVFGRLGIPLEE